MTQPPPHVDPHLAEHLVELAAIAEEAGAASVWTIRGAAVAKLVTSFSLPNLPGGLVLTDPHETIVVIRFPASDGNEPGIEAL